jgi:hypothetical protein
VLFFCAVLQDISSSRATPGQRVASYHQDRDNGLGRAVVRSDHDYFDARSCLFIFRTWFRVSLAPISHNSNRRPPSQTGLYSRDDSAVSGLKMPRSSWWEATWMSAVWARHLSQTEILVDFELANSFSIHGFGRSSFHPLTLCF